MLLSKATYSAFRLYIFCEYLRSLGIEPTTFALLTQCHWATGTEVIVILVMHPFWIFVYVQNHTKFLNQVKRKYNKCLIGKHAHSFAIGVSVWVFCALKCISTRSARAKILLYHFLKPWPRGEGSHCAKTSIQAELLPAQSILNSHISPGISLQPPNVIPFRDIMIF